MTIKQLREQLKVQRQALSNKQQQQLSKKIADRVIQRADYLSAEHIALYLPVRGEADPTPLFTKNTDPNKKFYLPILSSTNKNHLEFMPWNKDTQFIDNTYGIPEPLIIHSELYPANKLDLVIMPLLGFDKQGNRLGMGGGYYDRTFSFKQNNPPPKTPTLLAYAYSFQESSALKAQQWDVPFNAYITDVSSAEISPLCHKN